VPARAPTDRELILAVVNRYTAAMSARSVDDVATEVVMTVKSKQELQKQFDELVSERITPVSVNVRLSGSDRATADCVLNYAVEFKDRRGSQVRDIPVTMTLQKQDGRWVIVSRSGR
jgi:hypothetical protein